MCNSSTNLEYSFVKYKAGEEFFVDEKHLIIGCITDAGTYLPFNWYGGIDETGKPNVDYGLTNVERLIAAQRCGHGNTQHYLVHTIPSEFISSIPIDQWSPRGPRMLEVAVGFSTVSELILMNCRKS
ncbi:MAG: hypothetical protein COA58_02880 [Bacteroidetes bacterium]|nr:MAG: hypothetical protein COA58_02880 [Bacteroidota bacterium]